MLQDRIKMFLLLQQMSVSVAISGLVTGRDRIRTYWPRDLFIVNMLILSPPNKAFILSSKRISFPFLGFCRPCALM